MAQIVMNNLWCELITNNEQLLDIAREESSYEVEGWEYIKKNKLEEAQKQGLPEGIRYWTEWDGRFGVYKDATVTAGMNAGSKEVWFPTGLLDRILLRFNLETTEQVAFLDNQRAWDVYHEEPSYRPDFKPRDYQTECIDYIKANHITRGIIKSPTGSGKTILGAMLIKENYVPTLIIVDKTPLVDQWVEAIKTVISFDVIRDKNGKVIRDADTEIGVAQGKSNFNPSFITIVTQQSLNSWWKDWVTGKGEGTEWKTLMNLHGIGGWGQVIRDEVHHAGSPKGYDIMMQINAHNRWGFSATPDERQDQNLKQVACIGEIIYTIGAERLIAKEFLAKPDIHFLPTDRLTFEWNDRYPKVYREGITYNTKRNQQIVHEACSRARGKSVLVFVDLIEHGKLLESMMQDTAPMYGIRAEFVYGNHPDRDAVFARFHSRETNVLIATEGLIGEGYDYKAIDVVVIANGGKAAIRTIQKMGRGMRVTEIKRSVLVLDFADRCKYLGGHSKQRAHIWREWGFEPNISRTPWMEG
jgi:superfamily II DNA or RNA helicase